MGVCECVCMRVCEREGRDKRCFCKKMTCFPHQKGKGEDKEQVDVEVLIVTQKCIYLWRE